MERVSALQWIVGKIAKKAEALKNGMEVILLYLGIRTTQ